MSYYTHGKTNTRLHSIWKSMKARCYCPNWKPYVHYGARGITVCDEWKNSFLDFYSWSINNGYSQTLELDRIDVNGNYEPNNCRWITHREQTLNRRDTLYCIIGEEKIKLRDYCKQHSINQNTAKSWRYIGKLKEKLSEIEGKEVVVSGGKKND